MDKFFSHEVERERRKRVGIFDKLEIKIEKKKNSRHSLRVTK